jgi:tetratricopeptide (TPR) repeat protein
MAAVQFAPADVDLRKELYSLASSTNEWDLATVQVNALEALHAPQNTIAELRYRIAMGRGAYADAAALAVTLAEDESTRSLGQFYRGAALQAQGKGKEAEVAYRASLAAQPDAAEPLGALVRLYVAEKRDAEAIRMLQDTLAKSHDNVVALNLLGELELSSGRFEDAKASFARAIGLQKTWWRPYRGLAATQLALTDVPAAQRSLEEGIESTGEPQLFVELGLMMTNARRFDDAIALYEKGLAAHPHAEVLANNLAMLLVTEKTDPTSQERALVIIDGLTGSNDPAVLDTLGWVNYKAGRLGDAKVYLDRAVAKLPTAPLLRYHQAQVLADSGDSTGAKVAVTEALKSPQFSEREAAQVLSRQLEQKL